jgi:hypothetical protein
MKTRLPLGYDEYWLWIGNAERQALKISKVTMTEERLSKDMLALPFYGATNVSVEREGVNHG